MSALTIEEALRSILLGLPAVSALGIGDQVRVFAFEEGDKVTDTAPGILIAPEKESFENDLSGRGGARTLRCKIVAVAGQFLTARNLLEAVRTNGTNPSTGVAGYAGLVTVGSASVSIQMATLDDNEFEWGFLDDGSDEKYFAVSAGCQIDYTETP